LSDDITIKHVAEIAGRNPNTIRRYIKLILENIQLTEEQYLNLLNSNSVTAREIAKRRLEELYGLKVRNNNINIMVIKGEEKD
jgi:predicted transcriptional regulator